jgi:FdhD protein
LAIEVNGAVAARVMRTTGNDLELALGFCCTEGLIAAIDDIVSIRLCPDSADVVRVATVSGEQPGRATFLTSACAGGRMPADADLPDPMPVGSALVEVDALLTVGATLRQSQPIRREAGAVHAAAVAGLDGHLLAVREDVGRHNAIDKAIGACLHAGHNLGTSMVVSTGRASSEMALKAIRAGCPIAASLSGSTSLGAELAHALGLTLVCYLRSGRITVLTHSARIVGARSTLA